MRDAFLGQLIQRLLELLGPHGIGQTHAAQNLRREVRHAGKIEILAFRQRIADAQRPVIGNADDVARIGLLGKRAILRKEKLRRVQADGLAGSHLLDLHAAGKLAGAEPDEGDTVAVVRIHIRLDLENECGRAGFGGRDDALVGGLRPRRRRDGAKRIEEVAHAEIFERTAEEDRSQVAFGKGARIESLAGMAHEIEFRAECRGVEIWVQRGDFGDRHCAQRTGRSRIAVQQAHATGRHVDCADKIAAAPDRPSDRRGIERERFLDLIDEVERVAALAIHLVDEGDDRNVAQPAHLEQLARPRLDALGRVDHHHG